MHGLFLTIYCVLNEQMLTHEKEILINKVKIVNSDRQYIDKPL